MRISRTQMESLATSGGNVVAADGQKIGSIGQVYVDDSTGEPSFVTVKTGLFGTAESFVPLQDATVTGSDIRVAYNKTEVKDAPRVDPDERITPEEEQRLYAHYGISSPRGHTSGTERTGPSDSGGYGPSSNDTSGATTDDAMTRSEERLKVGTRKEEAGRARLRNVGAARSGPNISEEEHEVVLHQERPVVEKEAVPVERVRLGTETVTDQETVSEDVRKEQIDTDLDRGRTRRRSDR